MSTILVVDDEAVVRELAVEILTRAGRHAVGVASAREALALLERERVALVVSDVVMPEMTGVELMDELRERRIRVPLLLMTGGSPDPERTSRAAMLGAVGLLYKPFTSEELKHAVAAVLDV